MIRAWLSSADRLQRSDIIFVLAGREDRKRHGLQLFRQGYAPKILFSVARFEIRRFSKMSLPVPLDLLSVARELPPAQRHYFVGFAQHDVLVEHVQPGRLGTLTEIKAFSRWLARHPEIQTVLVIAGPLHLRRARICCRTLLGSGRQIGFIAPPEAAPGTCWRTTRTAGSVESSSPTRIV